MNIMSAKVVREMANNVKKDAFAEYIDNISQGIVNKAQEGKYVFSFAITKPAIFSDTHMNVFLHDIIRVFAGEGYEVSFDNSNKTPIVTLRW